MEQKLERRSLLAGMASAAAVTVIGFDAEARSWVGHGHHGHHGHGHGHHGNFHKVPKLDGELILDLATRQELGHDLGFATFTTPKAVLRPGSVRDIKKMVKYCRKRGIKVAARGQGHSTDGQSQVHGGLLIEMASLSTIHHIADGHVLVDAGATWRQLLEATVATGQTPPVLTGFIGLSIGGTLSMGGISGMAYNIGVQVEHVEELLVVTGKGQLKKCSEHHNRALFDAVLAGVGQYAIIVQAKLKLVPAEERAIDSTLRYDDPDIFMEDMRTLMMREEFDMVWGGIMRDANGFFFELNTTSFYTGDPPDVDFLLRDLSYDPASRVDIDGTYFDYQIRVDGLIAFLKGLGVFDGFMHPWFDVFLPEREFVPYVDSVLPTLAPDDVGTFGFVLIFPLKRSTSTRPLFRLPKDEIVLLFDILTSAEFPGFDAAYAERMEARNQALYEQARDVGGTRYPIGTMDFSHHDWRRHYGRQWRRVLASKRAFDPDHILAPGVGMFPD